MTKRSSPFCLKDTEPVMLSKAKHLNQYFLKITLEKGND